jgi:TRAP-type mannitol/chloroaromatic compound transport system permease small subunit
MRIGRGYNSRSKGKKMTKYLRSFVRSVDTVNTRIAQVAKFAIFAMIVVLLQESFARNLFNQPGVWVLELATFLVAAYFILGGAYSVLSDSQVRMDIFYRRWSPRKKAIVDLITFATFPIYFGVLFQTGLWHIRWSYVFHEVSNTAWAPIQWPMKAVITVGFLLMLLQGISIFIKDLYTARGRSLE